MKSVGCYITNVAALSAGFSPLGLSPVLWWSSRFITGKADNAALTFTDIADLSTSGHNATSGTCTYKTNIQNGQPVLRFNGTSDLIAVTFTLNQPYTIVVSASWRGSRVANETLLDGGPNTSRIYRSADTTINTFTAAGAGPQLTSTATTTFRNLAFVCNGASSSLTADNGTPATGTTSGGAGGITLGSSGPGGVEFGPVDVGDMIVVPGLISAGNATLLQAYLKGVWATP
jgi:hypothetical protein